MGDLHCVSLHLGNNILFKFKILKFQQYYPVKRLRSVKVTQCKKWVVGMVGGRQRCQIAQLHWVIFPPGNTNYCKLNIK